MNYTMYFGSLYFEFGYYIVMCIDLIITLKRPFIGGRSRMLFYNIAVILSAAILYVLTLDVIMETCIA